MSELTRTAARESELAGKTETVEPPEADTKAEDEPDKRAESTAAETPEVDAVDGEQTASGSSLPPTEPPAGPTTQAPSWFAWLIPGLAALLVVLLVLIAVFGYQAYNASRVDQARSQALSAATTAAVDVLSYDHRHLDQDFAKANRHLAPDFAKQYGKTTSTVVKPSALKIKAVVSAQVIKGSVVSATKDQVVTLLFVNQTTSSTLRSGKRTDLNRVRMTMERVDDRWLVASVQAL
jgi:Mce-associated membrane protein